jgi:hypothetical protein
MAINCWKVATPVTLGKGNIRMTNSHRPQLDFYFIGKWCSQLDGFNLERFSKVMTNSS